MSVMEIPDALWVQHYEAEVDRLIRMGMWKIDAEAQAAEVMQHCFRRLSAQIQCDTDWDYAIQHRDLVDDWWTKD